MDSFGSRCVVVLLLLAPACSEEVQPRGGGDAGDKGDAAQLLDQGGGGGDQQALDAAAGGDAAGGDAAAAEAGKPDASQPKPDTKPTTSEFKLYDGKNLQFTTADNGFHPLIKPGDTLPLKNWSSPQDYYNGEFHIRYVITAPSNQAAGKLQTCIWTMGNEDGDGKNYFPESCSSQVAHTGVGTYYNTSLVPNKWWKNGGVSLVFAHPERFLIRVVLRGTSGCNVTTYSVSNACWSEWPKYQNMKFRVTIVMVAKGDTFSGWKSYP